MVSHYTFPVTELLILWILTNNMALTSLSQHPLLALFLHWYPSLEESSRVSPASSLTEPSQAARFGRKLIGSSSHRREIWTQHHMAAHAEPGLDPLHSPLTHRLLPCCPPMAGCQYRSGEQRERRFLLVTQAKQS